MSKSDHHLATFAENNSNGDRFAPRVVIVDDFAPWRKHVRIILEQEGCQVVGEAADGSEAVEKAAALKPDVILLDIGLGETSGIVAAPSIAEAAPESKILFLSAHVEAAIVRTALKSGGTGYVLKANINKDLKAAIEAVLHGNGFISAVIRSHVCSQTHTAQFYADETALLASLFQIVSGPLGREEAAIVVARKRYCDELRKRLTEHQVNSHECRCITVDAEETLSLFMDGPTPNRERFVAALESIIEQLIHKTKTEVQQITVFGEMVGLLSLGGNFKGALILEQLWNEYLDVHSNKLLTLHCAYPQWAFADKKPPYAAICNEHWTVMPG